MVPPVDPFHTGWHVAAPHPLALKAYSLPSKAATNTRPLPRVGEDCRMDLDPASPCHRGLHTACPQPAAENAFRRPAADVSEVCDPTYTTPFLTAGESMIWASEMELHSGVVHRLCPQPS